MRVLVTGANGHIGCHVVRACLASGMTPVAFVRPSSDRRGLAGLDVEVREGDVLDAASVGRAMRGIELVFHLAAAHRNWAADEESIARPALEGTRIVLEAARHANVRRVVCTSTAATMGIAANPREPLDERHAIGSSTMMYVRAKLVAEHFALGMALAGGTEVVVVNPSGVFGPLDYRLTPATRSIVGLLHGDPLFFAVSVTDVRDVARGHVLAATKGTNGARYLLTGDVVLPADAAAIFKELAGVRLSTLRPPHFLARWMAESAVKKARASGGDAALTPEIVECALSGHLAYDSTRARTELGATFRPARDVMRDAFRWLLFVNALKPRVAARVRATLGDAAAPDPTWSLATTVPARRSASAEPAAMPL